MLKKAEEELRKSEEKFRGLFENAITGVAIHEIVKDEKGTPVDYVFLEVNESFEKYTGLKAENIIGKRATEVTPPEIDTTPFIEIFGKVVMTGEPVEFEQFIEPLDRHYYVGVYKLGSDQFVAVLQDITERKNAEEELKRSREQFMLAVNGSHDGIWDWDLRDNSLYLSPRWKEMIGYENSELPNSFSSFEERLHPEDKPMVMNYVEQYLEGKIPDYHMEFRFRHKDGTYIWILARGTALRDANGTPYRMAGSHTDITERKLAEEELKEKKSLLQSIINILPGILFVVDNEYNVIAVNDSDITLKLSKHDSANEIYGKKCYEGFMQELSPCSWCKIHEVMASGKTIFEETSPDDIREIRTGRALQISISPIIDNNGEVKGVVEYGADVTSLRNAKLGSEAANKAKSEFLANMSHEIRTPMNGIVGMTELLLDTDLNEEQRHYAQTVQTSGETLLGLINDILDFSKIEAGKFELEELDFDLCDMLDDLATLLSTKAQNKGLEFICTAAPDVPAHITGDPNRLKQILLNLTGNAIKFTEQGEVVVCVSLESETYTQAVLHFLVKDTGIGIPDNKKDILFNKFSQVDTSTTRRYGGTGLGLAISKQLVEMMGGDISVESEQGKGSAFGFTLVFEKHSGFESEDKQFSDIKGTHVLVVDDNATNRKILVSQLLSWNLNPEEAIDGPEALQKLQMAHRSGNPFQIALLDFQMPGMDGEYLARVIKMDPNFKDIALIMLSSLGHHPELQTQNRAHFQANLSKPVRTSELYNTLRNILGVDKKRPKPLPRIENHSNCQLHKNDLKILVVEDNIVNQTVAQSMLKKLGFSADIATNGAEALKKLELLLYDIVFMDIQMPEMDGIEATRIIRDPNSQMLNRKTPIIAMTAHAITGDRERFMEAGMDDYVSKPVSMDSLADLIEKWSKTVQEKDQTGNSTGNRKTSADPQIFNKESFVGRMMDDMDLVRKLIEIFQEDVPIQLNALKEAIDQEEMADVNQCAHRIKGSSINIGAELLSKVAGEMEQLAKDGNINETAALLPELEEQLELLTSHIEKL